MVSVALPTTATMATVRVRFCDQNTVPSLAVTVSL